MPSHIVNNKIINRFKVSNRKFLIYLQKLSSVCSKNNIFRIAKKKKNVWWYFISDKLNSSCKGSFNFSFLMPSQYIVVSFRSHRTETNVAGGDVGSWKMVINLQALNKSPETGWYWGIIFPKGCPFVFVLTQDSLLITTYSM